MKKLSSIATALLVTTMGHVGHARAQSSAQESSASESRLEEIVVTGTKTGQAEVAQKVPVAISAFSAEQLQAAQITDLTRLSAAMPSTLLTSNSTYSGTANFFMRGVGVGTSVPTDDPAVGVFVDGMYMGTNLGIVTNMFDVESVEVLRGPQGTLFGRNVTGGAVLLRSKRPTGDFGAQLSGMIGNFGTREANMSLEGPLVADRLAAKVAVMSKSGDGYFDNVLVPGRKIGENDSLIVRPMLLFTPGDSSELSLIAEFGDMDDYGTPSKVVMLNTTASPPPPAGEWDLANTGDPQAHQRWSHVIGEGNWDIGDGRLTATLTHRDYRIRASTDVAGTPVALFGFLLPSGMNQNQSSAELVYATPIGERINLSSGLYYFRQRIDYREVRQVLSTVSAGRGIVDEETYGPFVQADVDLTSQLTLTAGGRYTYDRKDAQVASIGRCDLSVTNCNYDFLDSESWTDFTPRVALRWQPMDNLQVYSSYTKGFRSGGYNVRNSGGAPGPYEPESVTAYEFGLKSEWLDRRLRLNAAVFRNDYDDMQVPALNAQAQQKTLNAGTAVIEGVELEPTLLLTDSLTVGGSYSYIDARYTSFRNAPIADPSRATDLDLVKVPRHLASAYGQYETDLAGDLGSVLVRASYQYTGRRAGDVPNVYFFSSVGVWDASATWTSAGGQVALTAFGTNLANKQYGVTETSISLFTSEYLAPPRQYGMRVDLKF